MSKVHCQAIAAFLVIFISGFPSAVLAKPETREIMQGVFDALAYLLPLSVRDPELSSQWDRELIDAKLKVLRNSSAALVAHTATQSPEFRFLASSFDQTVGDIDASFKHEWPSYAFFSLMELTQHCVACHSQQPADSRNEFSQRLLARVNTEIFDPSELAQLYVATHQFDLALSTLERKLLAADQDAIDLDFAGLLLDYLSIALGAAEAPARADGVLGRFKQRPDAPYYLKQRIAYWRERLAILAPELSKPPDLAFARKLINTATTMFRGPRDRQAAIDDLIAASILRRFIATQRQVRGSAVAEAYYLLGVISLRTMEPKYSVPELEILFASAIKADPQGAFSTPSFLLLEEFGYVRDTHLARAKDGNTLINMAELRHMIESPDAQ